MQNCMRRLCLCYGHRLSNYQGKCATLHGHNAVVEVHATPIVQLDDKGMVIDFSVLKEKVGGWIEEHWDHTMILDENDEATVRLIRQCPGENEPFLLPGNPTSENLAGYLLREVCPHVLRDSGVIVHKIVLWETENCFAEDSLDPRGQEAKGLYDLT